MAKVIFKPWIGLDCGDRGLFGQRVLILGESHYQCGRRRLDSDFTRKCVDAQVSGAESMAFWTNIAIAFLGKKPTLEEKGRFWRSVLFSNYIQESVGFRPRVAPSEEMWSNSRTSFVKLVARCEPDVIVVLGFRLWERLPDEWGFKGPRLSGARYDETWIFPHPGGSAVAFGIRHPSAGFSGKAWHEVVKRGLALARFPHLPAISPGPKE